MTGDPVPATPPLHYPSAGDGVGQARPAMDEVAQQTGSPVHLTIMSADENSQGARARGRAPAPAFAGTPQLRSRPGLGSSSDPSPVPVRASGAWRDGDSPGRRQFADIGTLELESGNHLPQVRIAYETWGTLNASGDNAILVLHALTADSHVTGPAQDGHVTAGWWQDMIGPGAPIDTNKYFVVAPNVVGGCQGSTGPASLSPDGTPWGSKFPSLTIRDQVSAEIALTRILELNSWHLVIGASMGGLRVLEWALLGPEAGIDVEAIAVIAAAAQTSGDQIAWAHPQITAIQADPNFNGGDYYDAPDGQGPHVGLGIARQIAHTTYRSAAEIDARFGRIPQGGEDPLRGGRFAVQSYLDHHAHKLARRFDANSYLILTEAMVTHDLGRDRGGAFAALENIRARALVVAVDSDRLFPPEQSQRMVDHLKNSEPLAVLTSDYGHDGFLLEFDQLGPLINKFLSTAQARPA